jgi:hypothetical protein
MGNELKMGVGLTGKAFVVYEMSRHVWDGTLVSTGEAP